MFGFLKRERSVRVHMSEDDIKDGKNLDGRKGKVCNNCGGYGYTMGLKGGRIACHPCDETGVVEMSNREIQQQMYKLAQDNLKLKDALLKTLIGRGLEIPPDLRGIIDGNSE